MKHTINLPDCNHSVTMKLKKSDEHTTCDLTFESDSGKHKFFMMDTDARLLANWIHTNLDENESI